MKDQTLHFQKLPEILNIYVVGQNEIQVKVKFLCLLTLIILSQSEFIPECSSLVTMHASASFTF